MSFGTIDKPFDVLSKWLSEALSEHAIFPLFVSQWMNFAIALAIALPLIFTAWVFFDKKRSSERIEIELIWTLAPMFLLMFALWLGSLNRSGIPDTSYREKPAPTVVNPVRVQSIPPRILDKAF